MLGTKVPFGNMLELVVWTPPLVAQIFSEILCYFEKHFFSKIVLATFLVTWVIGLLFSLISGHNVLQF